jgi:hypothetical protein
LPPRRRAPWLAAEAGLKAFGFEDKTQGRRRMVERLDRRGVVEEAAQCGIPELSAEVDARCSHLRRGWYWGTQAFAEKMLKLAGAAMRRPQSRDCRSSGVSKAHGEAQAREWLREGLASAGLDEEVLKRTKGTDARKVALARLLWEGTTVSQGWIARELQMSSAANVSQLLGRAERARRQPDLPKGFATWIQSVKT